MLAWLMRDERQLSLGVIKPLTTRNETWPLFITAEAPLEQRRAVVTLSKYLNRECGYGIGLSEIAKYWIENGWEAATFPAYVGPEHKWGLVGFALFETVPGPPTLGCCWIHPFWRNKGMLKRRWPEFIERYGSFKTQDPSKAMRGFLASVAPGSETH